MKKLRGIRHFFAAFVYSMSGLCFAIKEAAIRHELLLGLVHFIALYFAGFTILWIFLLSVLWVLVILMEILNTALESVVDLASPSYHDLAKRAKDLASFAVFCSLTLFFVGWFCALLNK